MATTMANGQRYVSSELTHFVGRSLSSDDERFELLVKVSNGGWLTHPPHNPNISGNLLVRRGAKPSANEMYQPQMVCFCDIPVQELSIHQTKYGPFGLAFSKEFLVACGARPVLYVPTSQGALAEEFDAMVGECNEMMNYCMDLISETSTKPGVSAEYKRLREVGRFLDFRIFSFLKFFDPALTETAARNYYMEREWRVVGNVSFGVRDIQRILLPRAYGQSFRGEVPNFSGQISWSD